MEKEKMIYEGNNIPGWMSPTELQWLFETAAKMKHIVEIGPWAGRSTHALLTGCSKGLVTAVDTWDQESMKDWGDSAAARFTFFKNFRKFDNLNILEMPSLEAVNKFRNKSVDMVFIDHTHTYEVVKADIDAWLPKAKKIISGHDFSDNWPGVKQAVTERFSSAFQLCDSIWYVDLTTLKGI